MKCVSLRRHLLHILLWFFLLLLCACGVPWGWQHPQGLGTLELQQATDECLELAQQEANNSFYLTPRFPSYDRHHYRHYPYWYDDFSPFSYDAQRRSIDEQRFFHVCMLAKGWRQAPVIPPR